PPEFAALPFADVWRHATGADPPPEIGGPYLRLSPLRHGTDGFFAATLVRKGDEGSDDHLRHPDRSRAERGEAGGPVHAAAAQEEVPRLRRPADGSARDDEA